MTYNESRNQMSRLADTSDKIMTCPPNDWMPCPYKGESHEWNSKNFVQMYWKCSKCGVMVDGLNKEHWLETSS